MKKPTLHELFAFKNVEYFGNLLNRSQTRQTLIWEKLAYTGRKLSYIKPKAI